MLRTGRTLDVWQALDAPMPMPFPNFALTRVQFAGFTPLLRTSLKDGGSQAYANVESAHHHTAKTVGRTQSHGPAHMRLRDLRHKDNEGVGGIGVELARSGI